MIYRFGAFELDEEAGELRHRGAPVAMQPKPLALLQLLLRERHRIVPLEELFERLWPDTAVTPGSLTRAVSLARRAIGDTHRGAIIRSFARRGYRFCGDVVEVGGEAQAPEPARPTPATRPAAPLADDAGPLVGREEALATLHAELEDARAGRGGLALVVGPPGIGKTRLVERFAEEVAARGPGVVFGRAREGEGVPPFWLWAQVLRRLLEDEVLGGPVRELAEGGGEIAALLPELGAPAAAPEPAGSAEQRRFLLFDAVARTLARCGRERPLLVVLEDVQWAGEASLRLLEHLAFELREARVMLLVTLRDELRERSHPVERVLALLRRQSHGREIGLRGFSRREVGLLLEHVLGRPPPADLTSELYARTGGVPLFLHEAVRLLSERGQLRHPERIAREGLVLPARSFDFVRRGLEGLEPATLALVETASVLGREFPIALLAAVAECSRDEALDRLDEAERAGLVEPSPELPATWRWVHALFQEAAYEGIPTTCVARRHREDPDAVASELAHHLHEGLAVADPEQAFAMARRAAAKAQRLLAYEQAATHLEQAAAALEHLPEVDPARRLETWLALGEAHRNAGDRQRRRQVFGRALEAARGLGDAAARVRAAIGLCDIAEWSVPDPVAEAALQETLDQMGDAPGPERARLLVRLAYQSVLEDRGRAEALAREAVRHARETGDPEALQEALYTLHFAIGGPDALDEREALVGELVACTPAGAALDTTVIALIDVASDRIERGDLEGARALRTRAEGVAGLRPHPGMVWHLRLFDAGLHLMQGRFEEARRLTEEAHLLGRRIGHPYAHACYDAHRVGIARERGAHEEVVQVFSRGLHAKRGATHYVRAVVARSLVALGRVDEARGHYDVLAGEEFAAIPRNLRWTNTMVETAHLCADLGDDDRARALADLLAPMEHHHGVLAVPVCYGGPIAFARARLLAALGRRAEALELLDEALEAARALGARPAQARIALAGAALLARSGARERARALREEAREIAVALALPEVEAAATEAGAA